jgi:hypothetical protein
VERKAEEQRNTDRKLAAAKQEAVRKVQEEIGQKVQRMPSQLETIMQQIGINENEQQRIREIAQEARNNFLEVIDKN